MFRGLYARGAEESLRQAIAIDRSQSGTVGDKYRNHLLLACGLDAAGRTADARAEMETGRGLIGRLSLGPEWLYMLGQLDARAGRLAEARRILALTEQAAGDDLTDSVMNRTLSHDQAYVVLLREIVQAEGHADDAIPGSSNRRRSPCPRGVGAHMPLPACLAVAGRWR